MNQCPSDIELQNEIDDLLKSKERIQRKVTALRRTVKDLEYTVKGYDIHIGWNQEELDKRNA